jgi:hypothetical protein
MIFASSIIDASYRAEGILLNVSLTTACGIRYAGLPARTGFSTVISPSGQSGILSEAHSL